MENIVDILGHYAQYDELYYLEDSWIGRVVVNEDKTFEGIGESYHDDQKFLLFGNIGNGIVNTYIVAGVDSFPRLYKGIKDGKKYYGDTYVTDGCMDLAIGECKMTLQNADVTREITMGEIDSIKKQASEIKIGLSDKQRELYEKVLESISNSVRKAK